MLDGDGDVLCPCWQCCRTDLESVCGRHADVACEVGRGDGEGLARACTIDDEFVSGGCQRSKGGSVGPGWIDGEVCDVSSEVLESHLCGGDAADARHLCIVNLECACAGPPLGSCELEGDAHLPGVRLCLEVSGVGLVAVTGDVEACTVVVVL